MSMRCFCSPLVLDAPRLFRYLRPSLDAAAVGLLLRHVTRGLSTNSAASPDCTPTRSVCSVRSLTVSSRTQAQETRAPSAARPKPGFDRPRDPRHPRSHNHDHRKTREPRSPRPAAPFVDQAQEYTAKRKDEEDEEDEDKDKWATIAHLVRSKGDGLPELPHASVAVIYQALHYLRRVPDQEAKIRKMVKYLAGSRGEKANAALYDALLVANWDADRGRAHEIWLILNEMRKSGMDIPSGVYHSALQALAIHPDHINRSVIVRQMCQRWTELGPEGHCSVLLGLLREGQYEMAAEKMDALIRDGVNFPGWLYDVYMYVFGMRGFLDEALELLHRRIEQRRSPDFGDEVVPGRRPKSRKTASTATTAPRRANDHPVSLNLWFFLLDECSRALHYQGTKYIWSRMVVRSGQGEGAGLLDPPDGVVLAVLHTASRAGDPRLATEAIQHLTSRGVRLGTHHYEPLIECYADGGELESALRVLCIMHDAGVPVHMPSTRAVLQIMLPPPGTTEAMTPQEEKGEAPEATPPPPLHIRAIDEAIQLLFKLRREHDPRGLPIAALDVVLEALCETGQLARAVDLYRHARELCPSSGPTAHTFSTLLSRCDRADAATFIAAEMAAFSVRPDHAGYDAMVRSHAADGDVDVALQYLMEIQALWPAAAPAVDGRSHGGSGCASAAGVVAQPKQPSSSSSSPSPQRWLTRDTCLVLIERCLREEDARVWDVVKEADKRGLDVEEDVRAIMGELGMHEAAKATLPLPSEGGTGGEEAQHSVDEAQKQTAEAAEQ